MLKDIMTLKEQEQARERNKLILCKKCQFNPSDYILKHLSYY